MPAVEQQDPQKLLTDWLTDLIAADTVSEIHGWSVGTVLSPGEVPVNAIRVRMIGGTEEQRVADRPRVDLRFWGDGSYLTEATVARAARKVLARIRRDFRASVVLDPTPLPDPASQTQTHILCTVELLTRGAQV